MMFTKKTLIFLRQAGTKGDDSWFAANEEIYNEQVKKPFVELITSLGDALGKELPHCRFSPRSISRPKAQNGTYKDQIHCSMSPPRTSRFEMPPGLYVSISPQEILFGAGVYMPSAGQLRGIRSAVQSNPQRLEKILQSRAVKQHFGGLPAENMPRGPKGYEVAERYRYLLLKKSYVLSHTFSPAELIEAKFSAQVVKQAKAVIPFMKWLEDATSAGAGWLG